ncbi:flagellar protein [Peribacillus frigoritolerans]|nr:flagellar protein [Peribacillus frigoritolerans]
MIFKQNSAQLMSQTKLPFYARAEDPTRLSTAFSSCSVSTNQKLIISKHAQLRMSHRNIDIAPQTWGKIAHKANEAKKMGVTESLIITDNAALIVSTVNNKVITVMDRMKQHHKFSRTSMKP